MKVLILLIFCFSIWSVKAQVEPKPEPQRSKPSLSLFGNLGASTDLKAIYLNAGGPAIRWETKFFRQGKKAIIANVAAGLFPSLWYHPDWGADKIRPTLGAGFQLSLQKISLIIPFYYVAYPNQAAK